MSNTETSITRRQPQQSEMIYAQGMTLAEMGKLMASSGFFADARDMAQAAVKIQAGTELGFPPMASMTGVHIIKGRVSLSANLMAAAIKRFAGGKYNYRILQHTSDVCEIEFFERGQSVGKSIFTRQDANKAGTQNIDKFPKNMLFARAMSNGAKWYCPDVFGGPIYTAEEMGAEVDESGEVVASQPTPTVSPSDDDHTPPARPAPKAAAQPAPQATDGPQTFISRISNVEEKKGTTNGKPWVKWLISVEVGGEPLVTFSDTIRAKAETAMAEDADVKVVWFDKGRGPTIQDILPVEAAV